MTNTYDEYADARYLQGRMDEQAAWVEAVCEMVAWYEGRRPGLHPDGATLSLIAGATHALDALLRRMGVE